MKKARAAIRPPARSVVKKEDAPVKKEVDDDEDDDKLAVLPAMTRRPEFAGTARTSLLCEP